TVDSGWWAAPTQRGTTSGNQFGPRASRRQGPPDQCPEEAEDEGEEGVPDLEGVHGFGGQGPEAFGASPGLLQEGLRQPQVLLRQRHPIPVHELHLLALGVGPRLEGQFQWVRWDALELLEHGVDGLMREQARPNLIADPRGEGQDRVPPPEDREPEPPRVALP